jgi:16S rRNA (guanine527-N7)-methyltransferase
VRENRKVAVPDKVSRRGRGQSSNALGQPPRHEQARPTSPPARHSPLPTDPAVLTPLPAEFWQIVEDGSDAMGIALRPALRAAIDAHVRLLMAWNEAINLTALRQPELIARGHLLDSLTGAAIVDKLLSPKAGAGRSMLDLGSGGGFPGLPLAFAVGAERAALVDSVNKKAAFLRAVSAAASTAFTSAGESAPVFDVLAERAEDLAQEPEQRAGWSVVVARAVGSMAELAELALPLLTTGGHLVAWKRDADGELRAELEAARQTIHAVGGSRPQVQRVDPHGRLGLTGHVLVTVRKARLTPYRYPRQPAERRRAALLR